MKTEIRAVDTTHLAKTSVPLHEASGPVKVFGFYVIDIHGFGRLISEHGTYLDALEAQAEFMLCHKEVLTLFCSNLFGNKVLFDRFKEKVPSTMERVERIVATVDAFVSKHAGFKWGADNFLPHGEGLPPFGHYLDEAVTKMTEAFEMSGWEVPALLLD